MINATPSHQIITPSQTQDIPNTGHTVSHQTYSQDCNFNAKTIANLPRLHPDHMSKPKTSEVGNDRWNIVSYVFSVLIVYLSISFFNQCLSPGWLWGARPLHKAAKLHNEHSFSNTYAGRARSECFEVNTRSRLSGQPGDPRTFPVKKCMTSNARETRDKQMRDLKCVRTVRDNVWSNSEQLPSEERFYGDLWCIWCIVVSMAWSHALLPSVPFSLWPSASLMSDRSSKP